MLPRDLENFDNEVGDNVDSMMMSALYNLVVNFRASMESEDVMSSSPRYRIHRSALRKPPVALTASTSRFFSPPSNDNSSSSLADYFTCF